MSGFVTNDCGEMPVVWGIIFVAAGKMPFIETISFEGLKLPSNFKKSLSLE